MMASQDNPSPTSRADDRPAILGLDNIALDLPFAGLGTRSLAIVVDGLTLAFIMVLWGPVWLVLMRSELLSEAWMLAIGLLGYFLIQWIYFFAFEAYFDGRTPGKMALSLQTVSQVGGRPSISSLLIRNLLRPIDYFAGVFFMALDPQSRRLGDRVAATLVVHREPEGRVRQQRRLGRMTDRWTAGQVALIEAFVNRAARMDPEVTQEIGGRLMAWIERTVPEFVAEAPALQGLPPGVPVDPVERLWAVLAVYEGADHVHLDSPADGPLDPPESAASPA